MQRDKLNHRHDWRQPCLTSNFLVTKTSKQVLDADSIVSTSSSRQFTLTLKTAVAADPGV